MKTGREELEEIEEEEEEEEGVADETGLPLLTEEKGWEVAGVREAEAEVRKPTRWLWRAAASRCSR